MNTENTNELGEKSLNGNIANCDFCTVGKSGFKFCSGDCNNNKKQYTKSELIKYLTEFSEDVCKRARTKTNDESTSIIVDKDSITNALNEFLNKI